MQWSNSYTNDGTLTYNGKNIELTKNEFKILQLLMRNKGKIVSRDKIMRVLWESEYSSAKIL